MGVPEGESLHPPFSSCFRMQPPLGPLPSNGLQGLLHHEHTGEKLRGPVTLLVKFS